MAGEFDAFRDAVHAAIQHVHEAYEALEKACAEPEVLTTELEDLDPVDGFVLVTLAVEARDATVKLDAVLRTLRLALERLARGGR